MGSGRGRKKKTDRGQLKVDGIGDAFNPDAQAGIASNSRVTITGANNRNSVNKEKKDSFAW